MESGSRCRDRIAAPLVCAFLACLMAACGDGYPRKDIGLDNPTAGVSAIDIVARLNRMNEGSLTATRWQFSLLGPCQLRMIGRGGDRPERILTVQLLHGAMQVKGNLGESVQAVQVNFDGTPELLDEHLFEAERWTDAVEYATHLQALQRICARSRQTPRAPAGASAAKTG